MVSYDERAFERLPILADALMDAGCDNADILAHCRGPGPHERGCWAVDLILGKPYAAQCDRLVEAEQCARGRTWR
jgi:hypothetical protein